MKSLRSKMAKVTQHTGIQDHIFFNEHKFEIIDGLLPDTKPQEKPHASSAFQSIVAEKGVIGSVLAEATINGPEAARSLMFSLERECDAQHFSSHAHREIWLSLCEMHHDNEPMDLVSVTQYMSDRGFLDDAGGIAYLTELFAFVPTGKNWMHYVTMLRQKSCLRQLASLGETIRCESREGGADPLDILQQVSKELKSIQSTISDSDEGIEKMSFGDLMDFDTSHDPDCLIGNRYLGRGGSLLIVGQSGIGKSSIAMQIGMRWAQGFDVFGGLKPKRPLKCMFIQAENDRGDMAEMMQGVMRRFPIPHGMTKKDFLAQMENQMTFVRDTIHSGEDFARTAAANIRKWKPDIVFADPLLSYAGDDISQQKVATKFLRDTLNPIAFDTGIVWAFLHHTGKPATDPKAKSHWNDTDFSYMAFGSSELVNWARATIILRSMGQGRFELRFGKRCNRTGIKEHYDEDTEHPEPKFTDVIYLQHAQEGIYWEQIQKPDDMDAPKPKKKSENTGQFVESISEDDMIATIRAQNTGRTAGQMCAWFCAEEGISKPTFYRKWKALKESRRIYSKNNLWFAFPKT